MSYVQVEEVSVTTAADGSATAYTGVVTGRVESIRYVKTDFDNGSTMTVTSNRTGASIWTESDVDASATRYPRAGTHDTSGNAETYDGTEAVNDKIAVANDRIKIVLSSGGATKTGTFYVTIG